MMTTDQVSNKRKVSPFELIGVFLTIVTILITVFAVSLTQAMSAKDGLVRSNLENAVAEVNAVLAKNPEHDFTVPYVPENEVLAVTTGSSDREIRLTADHTINYDRGINIVITEDENGYQLLSWHGAAKNYHDRDSALVYDFASGTIS